MISIIILTYNNDKYLKKAINSCLRQTIKDCIEIIVINDGSTDNTNKILKTYNERIKVFNKINQGIEKSFNFALKKISGDFFLRLDADDYLNEEYIEIFCKNLQKKYDFFYSNYYIINNRNKVISNSKLPNFDKKEIMSRGDFLASGTMFRKNVLKIVNGYNTSTVNCGLENYEFILKLINRDLKGYLINKPLWKYRIHNDNMSKLKKEKIISYGKSIFKNKNYGIYKTNKYHPHGFEV